MRRRTKEQIAADNKEFSDKINSVCTKAALYDKLQSADKVVEAVRQDLLNRSNVGIAKYGTTLDKNNGNMRYWINHAYEECLDQANYLKRLLMEIDNNGNQQTS